MTDEEFRAALAAQTEAFSAEIRALGDRMVKALNDRSRIKQPIKVDPVGMSEHELSAIAARRLAGMQ